MSLRMTILSLAFCSLFGATASAASDAPYDLIIRGGEILDGSGAPAYAGDVAIRDGHIAAVGKLGDAKAKRVIDAHGLTVAPGFIDMLGQSDLSMLVDPRVPSKIYQGITTEITGEGESAAPLSEEMIKENQPGYDHYQIKVDWRTLPEYFARLRKGGMGINLATYIGAASVREMVLGYGDRQPTPEELARMQGIVADGMRAGAMGLSTALQYTPAPYAKTEELVALAETASQYGGIYATHMRSEGNAESAALDETFRIAREAHIPVEIFHLKASGKQNWGKAGEVIKRIEAARASGLDVAADTYAYTAWENSFSAFIPPWAHDGGTRKMIERLKDPALRARIRRDMLTPTDKWDNEWLAIEGPQDIIIVAANKSELARYQGKRVSEIAAEWHEDGIDTICDFLAKDNGATMVAVFGMTEPDVALVLQQPWVSIDNDASGTSPEGIMGREHPHPRAYGTFPRIVAKYVRDEHKLTLPDAVRKFTSLAAHRMGLKDRGLLKPGMWADVAVFDADALHDVATFDDPNRYSVGMRYVLVNGVPVVDGGKMTDALPGQVILGPGYGKP
ncbi:MAG TPA: D-aminoacylase [Gammaproteobacteria bacterium]|jgi:dihydroorotase/N-acyl-D-amino-acid deacylase|nr:D-aminoacylase [Gammaproteobacteria bacterium]